MLIKDLILERELETEAMIGVHGGVGDQLNAAEMVASDSEELARAGEKADTEGKIGRPIGIAHSRAVKAAEAGHEAQ